MLESTRLEAMAGAAGRVAEGAVGDRSGSAGGRALPVGVVPDPELVEGAPVSWCTLRPAGSVVESSVRGSDEPTRAPGPSRLRGSLAEGRLTRPRLHAG